MSRVNKLEIKDGQKIKSYEFSGELDQKDGLIKPIGKGGAGIVYRVKQEIHDSVSIDRALKFFIFRADVKEILQGNPSICDSQFLDEIINVSSFSHENLIKVIDAGFYGINGDSIPYIVTEYIEGPTLLEVIEGKKCAQGFIDLLRSDPAFILDVSIRICAGIAHLHERNFFHCDIAPKNIFLKKDERFKPVIGDLGVGKSPNLLSEGGQVFVAGSWEYMTDPVKAKFGNKVSVDAFKSLQPQWDVFAFAKTCLEFLKSSLKGIETPWKSSLIKTFEDCMRGEKYKTINEINERLRWLRNIQNDIANVQELSPGLSGKRLKLLPVEPVVTSPRIRKLIIHPAILRLNNVPQLTMAQQVFPGGRHTRYEHCLGVMENMRQYLLSLLNHKDFIERLNASNIETALVSSLLYNITRFPFSSIIHEEKSYGNQEYSFFSRETILDQVLEIRDDYEQTIMDCVTSYFPSINVQSFKNIIIGNARELGKDDRVIYSLLNSSIDARVVDFVRRDSLHLGITTGNTISLADLLPHLTIENDRLAIFPTGISTTEQILVLRYWLFSRIYWNRPNRSYVSMIRHCLYRLLSKPGIGELLLSDALKKNAESMIRCMLVASDNIGMQDAVDVLRMLDSFDQRIYTVAAEYSCLENPQYARLISSLIKYKYPKVVELQRHVEDAIRNLLNRKCTEAPAVLIDVPKEPSDKMGADMMVRKHDGSVEALTRMSQIVKGLNESFSQSLQRLRVFIHPDLMPKNPGIKKRINQEINHALLSWR